MIELEKLVMRLHRIAKKNRDEFECTILVRPDHRTGWYYEFRCRETADDHLFMSSAAPTLLEAVAGAEKDIPDALKEWGYTE